MNDVEKAFFGILFVLSIAVLLWKFTQLIIKDGGKEHHE
jgi:hypothetical protein